ncbi:MAG: hypothetical protein K2L10_02775 [Ruminococcus sp.]|nr:hypothetical protein [Ruminococcus sp.]
MIYGLKYTLKIWTEKGFCQYAILERTDNHLYINCYNNGKISRKDITDKTDCICNMVKHISHWNMRHYNEPMEWLPSFDWTLHITTDDVNIYCSGHDNDPPESEYFDNILRFTGIS